ncbi:hypothetical protein EUZ87_15290 [Lactiplantibacillus paraplantarum]|uniref:Uncharacterized protein n=1 Tax=Lactiplantibacillus paraplantarum TaxID=60520 RepID=A0A4Q9XY60_9LACO|nr:hypothetical protein EUZ87_15290 [Lactiplantibacillus paraplantarum]
MDNDKQALATDKLATLPLDHNWYQELASNFEILQQYLNKFDDLADEVNSDQSRQSADLKKKLTDMQQQMNSRINRITRGADTDAIKEIIANLQASNSGVSLGQAHPVKALVSSFGGANFNSLDLYWTNDYLNFQPINKSVLAGTGTNVRDPSVAYFSGNF